MQSTKRSVFPLKKSIALIMALSVLVCGVFAACSSKKTDGQNSAADTTQAGLANADTEFGTEINKDGKEVDVVYEKDKKGKNHAYEINKSGEKVTNSNGDYVEVPIEDDNNNNGNNNNGKENGNGGNNNGGNGNVPYNTTKGAVEMLTKAYAADLRPNIQVNAIGPTITYTPMMVGLLPPDEKVRNGIAGSLPAQRIGYEIDVVGPAIFLASAASDMVTATTIYPDGGLVATS